VIDTATDKPAARRIKTGDTPSAIAISPDGHLAYVSCLGSATVSIIDTATREAAASPIKVGAFPLALAVSPDGSRVYVVKN
jgi:YVTN family beta-propeller protein